MGKRRRRGRCGDDDVNHLPFLLPEDVLISILVCLPVKSLLLFKSVCKSWLQLIESSFFIDLHTTFINSSSSSKFGGTFILQTTEHSTYEGDIKLYMLSSESDDGDGDGDGEDNDNNEDDNDQKKKMVLKLDEDLGFSAIYKDFELEDSLRMVGSCNGIICLHDSELMDDFKGCKRQHYSNLRDICLWNPATRQFRILPKSIPIQEKKQDFIGFGFDIKTKDYKVLRITPLWDDGSKVQVYSLSTDSWRLLEDINSLPALLLLLPNQGLFLDSGTYLNGSYFFVVRNPCSTDGMMLLSFDFTKEIFTTMQLQENHNRYTELVLSCMGDKMVVFRRPRIDGRDGTGYDYYDIWVLNQPHCSVVVNKESFTKLHSLRIKTQRGLLLPYYSEPICISNNGEFALILTGQGIKLQLINLEDLIGTMMCRADVYKESLVSIMGGGNDVLLRWQLPTHGTTYKLNLDAPFIDSDFAFGIGLCLTSDTCGCIGVRGLKRYVSDAEKGEAQAMLEAIKWAIKLELSPIVIESDSKNVVSFFMDDDDDNNSTYWSSEALSLLGEAKLLLNSSSEIGSISFQYCAMSCNYVADIAAKLGREGFWYCKEWTANFPGEMVRSLSMDLGSVTR